jgi:hypothetical protein
MKNSIKFIKSRIEAISGRFILVGYRAYSSMFIKKDGFTVDFTPPVRQQEIILIKRTNNVYSIASKQYSLTS